MIKKYKKIISLVAFSSVMLVSSGCKKTFPPLPDKVEGASLADYNRGCNDIDSPYYDANAAGNSDCKYAYVTSYEITYYPDEDGNTTWDFGFGNTTNADLILNVTVLSSAIKVMQGAERSNQDSNTPAFWNEAREIRLENKVYKWNLDDYDSASPNDPISNGTFNPVEEINNGQNNGTITTVAGGSQLVLHYIIK